MENNGNYKCLENGAEIIYYGGLEGVRVTKIEVQEVGRLLTTFT